MLAEYEKANSSKGRSCRRGNIKWQRPTSEFIQINVDATVDFSADRVGIGFVPRNIEGSVLMAASKSVWPFYGVERVEIGGFLWAVQLVKSLVWMHCIFEGDAKVVIEALNGKVSRAAHNQVLIDNILTISSGISHASFVFCFGRLTWLPIGLLDGALLVFVIWFGPT